MPVYINGQRRLVTASLASHLRHSRHEFEHKAVWADAICINQFDDQEKSHQVSFMQNIFAAASTVRVFFNNEGPYAPRVHRAVETLMQTLDNNELADAKIDDHPFEPNHFERILELSLDPWWTSKWLSQPYRPQFPSRHYPPKVREM